MQRGTGQSQGENARVRARDVRVVKLRGVADGDGGDVLRGKVELACAQRGKVPVADEQQRRALALVYIRAFAAQGARVAQHDIQLLAGHLVGVEEALVDRVILCLQGT